MLGYIGPRANAGSRIAARRIAEAQVDLARIRQVAKLHLYVDPRDREPPRFLQRLVAAGQDALRTQVKAFKLLHEQARLEDPGAKVPQFTQRTRRFVDRYARFTYAGYNGSIEQWFDILAPKLLALERYERRALSRRKRAIRDYDALCARI